MVLAGDSRLNTQLKLPQLIPLGTRIRTRLTLEAYTKQELLFLLQESCRRAGNAKLITDGLQHTLVEHSAGNPRILMTIAGEVLALGMKKEVQILDETLYLELYNPQGLSGGLSQKKRADEKIRPEQRRDA